MTDISREERTSWSKEVALKKCTLQTIREAVQYVVSKSFDREEAAMAICFVVHHLPEAFNLREFESLGCWLARKAVLVLRAPDKFVEFTGLNEEFPKGWGFTKGDVVKTHEEVVMVVSAKQGEQSTFERFSVHASRNHTANRSIFR
jgi:hypothetical protein